MNNQPARVNAFFCAAAWPTSPIVDGLFIDDFWCSDIFCNATHNKYPECPCTDPVQGALSGGWLPAFPSLRAPPLSPTSSFRSFAGHDWLCANVGCFVLGTTPRDFCVGTAGPTEIDSNSQADMGLSDDDIAELTEACVLINCVRLRAARRATVALWSLLLHSVDHKSGCRTSMFEPLKRSSGVTRHTCMRLRHNSAYGIVLATSDTCPRQTLVLFGVCIPTPPVGARPSRRRKSASWTAVATRTLLLLCCSRAHSLATSDSSVSAFATFTCVWRLVAHERLAH